MIVKKTIHIDDELLQDAKGSSYASTNTETVRLGLEMLVRHGAYQRLRALRGSNPDAQAPIRHREAAAGELS